MGAGLVAICAELSVQSAVIAAYPEAIVKDRAASETPSCAVLIGCGLGRSSENEGLLRRLISTEGAPLVIDADGINTLAALPDKWDRLKNARRQIVLTPHPLEFARLTDADVGEVQANRLPLAEKFAREYGVTLVLKGAGTVIASPDGAVAINQSGSSALAKGGSGDVLAGAITGLLAQGFSPFHAAAVAVYLHGKAGDRLASRYSEYGVLPHELPLQMAEELTKI
jgi:NAD(P)H-hydrate epimerase